MPTPNAEQLAEVTFLSGVNGDGTLAATSFWTWDRDSPATYGTNHQSKFGTPAAGTGATIEYAFAAASNWSDVEKAAFRGSMSLWSAIADVGFVDVSGTTYGQSAIVISRSSDDGASGGFTKLLPGTIGTTRLGQSLAGRIDIDTGVPGFGPLGEPLPSQGGYPWTTLAHEIGHVIGLGHGGAYNEGDTKSTPQFTTFDSLLHTIMSYNGISSAWSAYSGSRFVHYYPTTPMSLDILAAQRLYGKPTNTPLSGGQVFGYNSNIGGDIGKFFDFSINTKPVITIWDAGTNNTLDLSRSADASYISLLPGSSSSAFGLSSNIAIAFDTQINRFIGGSGATTVYGNDFGNSISTGSGSDTIHGGAGNDTIDTGGGSDFVYGGGGIDTVYFNNLSTRSVFNYNSLGEFGSASAKDGTDLDYLHDVERIRFLDGEMSYDASSNAAAVYRLYDTVLARAPDALGLDQWSTMLRRGTPLADVANGFTGSAEFRQATGGLSNADFVEYLYVHALRRPSDPGGKAGWVATLDAGTSRGAVTLGFSESAEEQGRTASAVGHGLFVDDPDYQQVAALYDSFGNRLPDPQGLVGWGTALSSGRLTLGQVADGFAGSAEFATRVAGLSNPQLVDFMYRNTLDRPGDPDGVAGWVYALDHGLTVGQLLLGFSSSQEHLQLLAPQITGGILTG